MAFPLLGQIEIALLSVVRDFGTDGMKLKGTTAMETLKTLMVMSVLIVSTFTPVFAERHISEARYHDWRIRAETNLATNATKRWIYTRATVRDSEFRHTSPFMGINCDSIYFGDLDVLDSGAFTFRTNAMTNGDERNGDVWEGNDGLTLEFANNRRNQIRFWENYEQHFQNMRRDNQIYVMFDSFARSNQTVTFSLSGFSAAIDTLSSFCVSP